MSRSVIPKLYSAMLLGLGFRLKRKKNEFVFRFFNRRVGTARAFDLFQIFFHSSLLTRTIVSLYAHRVPFTKTVVIRTAMNYFNYRITIDYSNNFTEDKTQD